MSTHFPRSTHARSRDLVILNMFQPIHQRLAVHEGEDAAASHIVR